MRHEPVAELSRSLGLPLTEKAARYYERRPFPPGVHGQHRVTTEPRLAPLAGGPAWPGRSTRPGSSSATDTFMSTDGGWIGQASGCTLATLPRSHHGVDP